MRPDGGGDAGAEPGQPLLEQARRDGVRGDEDVALAVGAEIRDDVGDLRRTAEDERGTDGNAHEFGEAFGGRNDLRLRRLDA